MKSLNCASALMMGIGAGYAIGLLLAPKPGLEIRTDLTNQLESAATKLRSQVNAVLQSAADAIDHRKAEIVRTKDGLKHAIDAGTQAYRQTVAA